MRPIPSILREPGGRGRNLARLRYSLDAVLLGAFASWREIFVHQSAPYAFFARDQRATIRDARTENQGTRRRISQLFFLAQKILSQATDRSWVLR